MKKPQAAAVWITYSSDSSSRVRFGPFGFENQEGHPEEIWMR